MVSPRKPRPLSASTSFLRALRACGASSVGGLRRSRKRKPTLSLVTLERLETEISARLHEDILVQLALRDPIVELFTGIGDPIVMADAADEHEAPDGWVCVSFVYSDPVGELAAGAHGAAYYYIAVPREPDGDEARILVGTDGLDASDADEGGETLCAFLDRAMHDAHSGEWQEHCHIVPIDREELLDPVPALVPGKRLVLETGTGERVTHAKFGVGEVVRREGDGDAQKVVVRFADHERTVLARFLR